MIKLEIPTPVPVEEARDAGVAVGINDDKEDKSEKDEDNNSEQRDLVQPLMQNLRAKLFKSKTMRKNGEGIVNYKDDSYENFWSGVRQ